MADREGDAQQASRGQNVNRSRKVKTFVCSPEAGGTTVLGCGAKNLRFGTTMSQRPWKRSRTWDPRSIAWFRTACPWRRMRRVSACPHPRAACRCGRCTPECRPPRGTGPPPQGVRGRRSGGRGPLRPRPVRRRQRPAPRPRPMAAGHPSAECRAGDLTLLSVLASCGHRHPHKPARKPLEFSIDQSPHG